MLKPLIVWTLLGCLLATAAVATSVEEQPPLHRRLLHHTLGRLLHGDSGSSGHSHGHGHTSDGASKGASKGHGQHLSTILKDKGQAHKATKQWTKNGFSASRAKSAAAAHHATTQKWSGHSMMPGMVEPQGKPIPVDQIQLLNREEPISEEDAEAQYYEAEKAEALSEQEEAAAAEYDDGNEEGDNDEEEEHAAAILDEADESDESYAAEDEAESGESYEDDEDEADGENEAEYEDSGEDDSRYEAQGADDEDDEDFPEFEDAKWDSGNLEEDEDVDEPEDYSEFDNMDQDVEAEDYSEFDEVDTLDEDGAEDYSEFDKAADNLDEDVEADDVEAEDYSEFDGVEGEVYGEPNDAEGNTAYDEFAAFNDEEAMEYVMNLDETVSNDAPTANVIPNFGMLGFGSDNTNVQEESEMDYAMMCFSYQTSDECDVDDCMWCSASADFEGCVPKDVASMVDGIPHISCVEPVEGLTIGIDDIDSAFWDDLEDCLESGTNAGNCLVEDSDCVWGQVDWTGIPGTEDLPTTGICVNEEFPDWLMAIAAMASDDAGNGDLGLFNWISAEDFDGENVQGILDPSCIEVTQASSGAMFDENALGAGFGEFEYNDCQDVIDTMGVQCVSYTLMGFLDLCVTEQQAEFLDFGMDHLGDLMTLQDEVKGKNELLDSYLDSYSGMLSGMLGEGGLGPEIIDMGDGIGDGTWGDDGPDSSPLMVAGLNPLFDESQESVLEDEGEDDEEEEDESDSQESDSEDDYEDEVTQSSSSDEDASEEDWDEGDEFDEELEEGEDEYFEEEGEDAEYGFEEEDAEDEDEENDWVEEAGEAMDEDQDEEEYEAEWDFGEADEDLDESSDEYDGEEEEDWEDEEDIMSDIEATERLRNEESELIAEYVEADEEWQEEEAEAGAR